MNTSKVIEMLDNNFTIKDIIKLTMAEGHSFEKSLDILEDEFEKAKNLTKQLIEGMKK